jgi:exopolysaccharide biosynthesis polyprenyl glycosylphosphotransferase
MYEALTGKVKMSMLYGLPLIDINPHILTEYQQLIKRLIDLLMSTILFVAFLPISILSMVAIKFSSPGSIFYIQRRVGKNNRSFKLFKFRTMFENSETDSGPVWASIDDPRITGIGRLLRKFRIDEIPQLLNVFIGDMSIVGPRPERPFFVEKLTARFPYYSRRLCVRPGITGWAQVVGDYDTTLDNVDSKLKHDFYYIENISMLLDIKIMFMTLFILLKGRGR